MLREQVLREWKICQQKVTKLSKDIEFLDEQTLFETALPAFPIGLDTIRRNLDRWTSSEFRVKINQNQAKVREQQNSKLVFWVSSYLTSISMFEELTTGWKQERDSHSGPTLEDV